MAVSCSEHALHVFDVLATCFLFFPLMTMYWRGIWDLWGVWVLPDDQMGIRHLVLLPVGGLAIIGYLLAPLVERHLKSYAESNRKCYFVFVRLYMYVFAAFYMCYWRAVWETADQYLSAGLWQNALTWFGCWSLLLLMGVSRTAIFPPFIINVDTRKEVLTVCTRFGSTAYSCYFIADCFFTYFIIITVTIVCWRSIWNTMVMLILPERKAEEVDLICLGIGYLLALTIFALQPLLAAATRIIARRGFWAKLIWEDILYTFVFISSVVLWRGAWNCCATYIIKQLPLGGWVNHIAGTVGLMMVQLFSYVGALGCGRDGLEPGDSAVFPIRYFRHYFIDEHQPQSREEEEPEKKEREAGEGSGEQATMLREGTSSTMMTLSPDERHEGKLWTQNHSYA